MSLLAAQGILKRFGGLVALDNVSFTIEENEFIGLIGPNGSGKTTLLNVLSGFYGADAGELHYEGRIINGVEPQVLATRGLTRTFQVTKIFRRITVLENLLVPGLTDWSRSRASVESRAMEILEMLDLRPLAHDMASSLSGGQGKLLEFGRLMMLSPKVVLLDEPFGGVHPTLKSLMHGIIRGWQKSGVTIVLVSHDMTSIFGLSERVLVLHNGALIADGTPDAVRKKTAVVDAYLGDQGVGAAP